MAEHGQGRGREAAGYGDVIRTARRIARAAHEGQTDIAGLPYITHPEAVASFCHGSEAKAAALLHDVLEDTAVTAEGLREAGIPEKIVHVVELLTKRPGQGERGYFSAIMASLLAREVKLADLRHNSDPSRIPHPGEKDRKRTERYRREAAYLRGRLPIEALGWDI